MGFQVFFITARNAEQRKATIANLRSAGYKGWDDQDLITEPDASHYPYAAPFKAEGRRKLTDAGYTIVLNIGDQDSDLRGGFADRVFKLPNPFYYIP